jgi:hypothetical protein
MPATSIPSSGSCRDFPARPLQRPVRPRERRRSPALPGHALTREEPGDGLLAVYNQAIPACGVGNGVPIPRVPAGGLRRAGPIQPEARNGRDRPFPIRESYGRGCGSPSKRPAGARPRVPVGRIRAAAPAKPRGASARSRWRPRRSISSPARLPPSGRVHGFVAFAAPVGAHPGRRARALPRPAPFAVAARVAAASRRPARRPKPLPAAVRRSAAASPRRSRRAHRKAASGRRRSRPPARRRAA